jgi:hypothetical protein
MIGLENDPMAIAQIDSHMQAVGTYARSPRHKIFGGSGGTHVCQAVLESFGHFGTQLDLCLAFALAGAANGFGVKSKLQLVGPFG